MVRANDTKITGPDSLRASGAKVCTATGTTSAEHILSYVDKSQLVLYDVYSKCADALRSGQVDAVTTERAILLGLLSQSGGAFRVLDRAFTSEPWGIGIPKGDVAFCRFIDTTLARAAKDGSYAQAWAGTVGTVTIAWPTLPTAAPCS